MPRPRKYRVNRDRFKVTKSGPKTRNLVECKCLLHCGGSKLVDPRTFERHRKEIEQLQAIATGSQASRSRGTSKKHNISKERKKAILATPIDGPKRQKCHNKFRDVNLEQPNKLEPVQLEDKVPSDDDGASTTDEDDVPIEEFTAPDFNDLELDHEYFDMNINFNDSWILLWIFKYQARFRVPDVAIESLIKFFRMVLLNTDRTRFENFSTSFYMAKKLLGINKRNRTCVVCSECNILYKISEILPGNPQNETNTGFQCTYVEFPNHPMRNKRQICGTELTNKVPQLTVMYQRPGFEESLQKWTNRRNEPGLYTDIYDRDTADFNLGIMINLDLFQPFNSSAYSSGVIYGVICNLPRDIRFKQENMLYLGLLPGPEEVKLHKINHFLSPIVDELLEFWDGVDLPSANSSGRRFNFGGFDDMDDWYISRDPNEHRQNAELWRQCRTQEERKKHVSDTHVRWSEMLRLPYFNPIRHLIVDPMHCLFLGIAHWIVKKLWIDSGKITKKDLELMERRAKALKVPADIRRIPYKIATGEGFSGFTVNQ
ncbi:uncharacterized protein LOC114575947 [Rhizophagus irregularis DAOM 181602=DAOM 197198]|nr:uncharacterized protein LOC114575947 [Rhizophagus irregularis DAOM 181602=DAOM 197198]